MIKAVWDGPECCAITKKLFSLKMMYLRLKWFEILTFQDLCALKVWTQW
jgi:hypothetical protein